MLALGNIFFGILSFIFFLATLYFFSDYIRKPKVAYCFAIGGLICLLITLSLNNTLREIEQSRRLYRHEEIVEPTETHTICFKDGSLYQTNFYGNSDLIEESAEGFYRFHIIRYASGNPIAVPQVISIAETDELIIEPTCHKPLVKEYTLYKKLITPEGETCYESSESRYVLILPPNSIKRISSFEGS